MPTAQTNTITTWENLLNKQSFSWVYFQFILKAREALYLPPYKGSAIRGGFGASFRRVCCTMKDHDCYNCTLNQTCPYAYIFETPKIADSEIQHQAANLPHPFIIEPPATTQTEFQQGDQLTFGLVLIGKSISFLPYFVYTFDQLGRMGLGRGRGKFELTKVYAMDDLFKQDKTQVYDSQSQILNGNYKVWNFEDVRSLLPLNNSESIRIQLVTPLRIVQKKKLVDNLPFDLFVRTLLRRISLLGRIHCESDWDLPYQEIIEQAEQDVHMVESDLTWVDWERYSTRQKKRMKLGGIIGTITYEGQLPPFLPFIYLGQFIHIGKNTTFGLGKYVVS